MVVIKVKICGVDREEALKESVDAGASMIGIVFFEKSPGFFIKKNKTWDNQSYYYSINILKDNH